MPTLTHGGRARYDVNGAPRGRDFLGKCVARDSSFGHPQCQEP